MEAPSASMLLKKLIKLPDSTSFRYLLSLPPSYSEDLTKRWPLILFLHGSGESGADLERVKIHGIPRLVQVYDDWKKGTALADDVTMEGSKITVIPEKDSSVKPKKPINLECAKIVAKKLYYIIASN